MRIEDIIQATALVYGLPLETFTSSQRTKRVSEARSVAIHVGRFMTGASSSELAPYFNRESSTIRSYALAVEKKLAANDQHVAKAVIRVTKKLGELQ